MKSPVPSQAILLLPAELLACLRLGRFATPEHRGWSCFRIVQVVLQLYCFSFASGELCDEVINHCVPDLNPCQHESKCLPLDKGTR